MINQSHRSINVQLLKLNEALRHDDSAVSRVKGGSYPTMAAVGRVLCCGWVEALVDSVTSLPPFSQSKGSFSVMIRSFMLFSNTDISSWTTSRGQSGEPSVAARRGRSLCHAYLVVRFGVVVQGQNVVQEDFEPRRHVFEQHLMVITLFDLTDLFLEKIVLLPL